MSEQAGEHATGEQVGERSVGEHGVGERVPFVRVVVLNWNSAWFTARCLRSLELTDYPADRFEVVVVDNASIDGSRERIAHDFPDLRMIRNAANLGFAEACNRAMRDVATGQAPEVDLVALVNNDAVVEPTWLWPLVRAVTSAADVGAACPKILLETPFVDVPVYGAADGSERLLERVRVDGYDVTRRILPGGLTMSPHPTLPLEMLRRVRTTTSIGVPVARANGSAVVELEFREDGTSARVVRIDIDTSTATRRINSLGTDLTRSCEGYERSFGERDRGTASRSEVAGWSGGGVVLRAEMLQQVGVFDPKFFAYYEDTDLAWRARRHGWRTLVEPASRIHHQHGGSAGATARPFFFLNYRNWLLTVTRNGTHAQRRAALAHAWHLSWPYVRRNVTGRVRRLRRPDTTIAEGWVRVAAGVLERRGEVRRSRTGAPVGLEQTDDVTSRWMPPSSPRPPAPRLGGPTIVYADVTETLRSGWRAGIQRVTCEVVRHLPTAGPDLELVPIVYVPTRGAFRRVTPEEYAELLAPTARQRPRPKPRPMHPLRRQIGRIGAGVGLTRFAQALRRRRAMRAEPALHAELVLERLEPGSVFLDLDATWNVREAARSRLLPRLAADGVRVVEVLYDLLPITTPDWFEPKNAAVFADHVDAHARAAHLVLAISQDTAAEYRRWLERDGRTPPPVAVVPLGAELPDTDRDPTDEVRLPDGIGSRPYLLVVGTVEPRKNHATALDAYERLRARHPDVDLDLVIVGRPGWRSEATIERIRRHVAAADGVHWLETASDAELELLYRDAFAVVAASFSEGFGLPVAEALARGRVVLSSTGGALPEAGGDAAEYFDPSSAEELAALVERHLFDPAHHAARLAVAAATAPRRWADLASAIAAALNDLSLSMNPADVPK